jgi:hypothetical protein
VPDPTTRIDTADVLAVDAAVMRSTDSAGFGVTTAGFVAKPFARLLAEKLALARSLFGEDLDLTSGSAIRKLLEISALEDARTWAALSTMYDNGFVATATGDALSRLGDELGLPRPFLEARGSVALTLTGSLPATLPAPDIPSATLPALEIPRGARMLTPGGHHVATEETVLLSADVPKRDVAVVAFYPGPGHNLDPANPQQKIDRWNEDHIGLQFFKTQRDAAKAAGTPFDVQISQTAKLTGGELLWPDTRYRQLLLRAPRSLWTADAIQIAASLVPGVRQVLVRDAWGGLDINKSIFGNFNFIERLFSSDRDIGTPYYLTVLVAPTLSAIWDGPGNLHEAVESAIEDLRPISIFPAVQEGTVIGVGFKATVVVRRTPLPGGTPAAVNQSQAAKQLKARMMQRVKQYVDNLSFGEPVRAAEVTWALMGEPAVADVHDLMLLRYPSHFEGLTFSGATPSTGPVSLACGVNLLLGTNEIGAFVDDDSGITLV